MKYVNSAPDYLKGLYEGRNGTTRKVKYGKKGDLLGELLSDPRMEVVWNKLRKKNLLDNDWLNLWQTIWLAIADSRKLPPRREDESAYLSDIAKLAAELSRKIRRKSNKAVLDLPAYLFSSEIMAIQVPGWEKMTSLEKGCNSIIAWPSMVELLDGLESMAKQMAKEVMLEDRVVERAKREPDGRPTAATRQRYFLKEMHQHLSPILPGKRDAINIVIGTISAIAFQNELSAKEISDIVNGK